MKKFLKLLLTYKISNKIINYIQDHVSIYQLNIEHPNSGRYIPFFLYKHQRKYIRYLNAFENIVLIKSKQVGETSVFIGYSFYKMLHEKNQNIIIVFPNSITLLDFKTKILSMLSKAKILCNVESVGIDFPNNNQITFLLENEFLDHINEIKTLDNLLIQFNSTELGNITINEIYPILNKPDSRIILVSSSEVTSHLKIFMENKLPNKMKTFSTLIISTFKVSVRRNNI